MNGFLLDVYKRQLQTSAENHTADTAKAIDTYFDTHFTVFLLNVLMKFSVDVIIIH